jgi:arylsulfatase A-like enzyme
MSTTSASAERPNVLLVHWHDVGRHLGAYGYPGVESPTVDALAEQGIRFDQAHATAPLCSPARGSLFTGRYPHANGLMGLAHLGWSYHPGERTLPMLLGDAGYRTALVGFQHEGPDPGAVGFGEYRELDAPEQYCGPVAEMAAEWLRDEARDDEPFFLTVGLFEPHRPYPADRYPPGDPDQVTVPPFLPDNEQTRLDLAGFQAAISAADAATATVLDALAERGLADSTIVLFTSDHGIAFPGAKSTLYDPGIEVAMLMRLPARWPGAGTVCDELVRPFDVLPTLLELLDVPVPETVQGHSFAPWLTGGPWQPREEVFAEKNWHDEDQYDPMRCVRTDRLKYIESYERRPQLLLPGDIEASPTRAGLDGRHLAARAPRELYDLAHDPWERHNLIDDQRYGAERDHLARLLAAWREDTGDPLLAGPVHRKR